MTTDFVKHCHRYFLAALPKLYFCILYAYICIEKRIKKQYLLFRASISWAMYHISKVMVHELSKSHKYMRYSFTITVIFITDAKHTIRYSLRRRHITGTPCSWVTKRYISTNIICILNQN